VISANLYLLIWDFSCIHVSLSTIKVLARELQSASLPSIRSMLIHLHFVRLQLTAFWLFQQILIYIKIKSRHL